MQDAITQSEQHALQNSGNLLSLTRSLTAPQDRESAEQDQPAEISRAELPLAGTPSSSPRTQRHALLPRKERDDAAIAGVIGGLL